MVPHFRQRLYGRGLVDGTERSVGRLAHGRGISLEGVRVPNEPARSRSGSSIPFWVPIAIFIVFALLGRLGGGPRRRSRYWGGGPWSGWSSGVGPFGGGW